MSDDTKIPDLKACPVYSEAFREVFPDNGRYEELRSAAREFELSRWRARGTHQERAPEPGDMINTTYEQADIEYVIRELSKRRKGSESLVTTWERTATVRPHVALDAVYAALKGAKGSIGAWPPDVGMALDRLRTAIAEVERER